MKRRAPRRRPGTKESPAATTGSTLRIVGGQLRGRRLAYSGDPRVRPMKDRTREAVFNLVGPSVQGTRVWDLFAGTGAMALEALSRGASTATLFERHIPTSKVIARNIAALDLDDRAQVVRSDVFAWCNRELTSQNQMLDEPPWLVICCPPYALLAEQTEAFRQMLLGWQRVAPPSSQLVVEAEAPFDFEALGPGDWTSRNYAPAAIGILRW